MRLHSAMSCSVLCLVLSACTARQKEVVVVTPPQPRLVSIEVEAYDPVTNLVWENVGIRIVDGTLEWSGLTIENVDPNAWEYTDSYGTVYFDEFDISDSQIGFVEDSSGRAVLEPDFGADEAVVQIELSAPGFQTVRMDVNIDWEQPDVFISVPFGF